MAKRQAAIRLDVNNMMEHTLGRGRGISRADIERVRKAAPRIHAGIQKLRRAGETPFYDIVFGGRRKLEPMLAAAREIRRRYDNLVVLGIGGSALGARALHTALNHPLYNSVAKGKGVRLFVADNVDPVTFAELLDHLEPARTCFNVISKSGETTETLSQFLIARDRMIRALGPRRYREHFLLTTDADKGPLRQMAREEGLRSFSLPDGIVGRYSVFSAVGLIPAAAAAIDVRSFLDGARDMADRCAGSDLWRNPAYMSAALHFLAQRRKGKGICVLMPYSDLLTGVAEWFCQLWAESLGKEKDLRGKKVLGAQCPVRALGTTDQHSQIQLYMEGPDDKIIDFIRVEHFARAAPIARAHKRRQNIGFLAGRSLAELIRAEQRATEIALAIRGRMSLTILLNEISAYTLGQLLFMFEIQTVFAAGLYGVNPFDQPAVELGKQLTFAMMGRRGYEKQKREVLAWQKKKKRSFIL